MDDPGAGGVEHHRRQGPAGRGPPQSKRLHQGGGGLHHDPGRFYPKDFRVRADASGRSGSPARRGSQPGGCIPCGQGLSGGERARRPVAQRKRSGAWVLRFTTEGLQRAERRRRSRPYREGGRKRRPGRAETPGCSAGFPFVRMIWALRWRLLALRPLQRPAQSR